MVDDIRENSDSNFYIFAIYGLFLHTMSHMQVKHKYVLWQFLTYYFLISRAHITTCSVVFDMQQRHISICA